MEYITLCTFQSRKFFCGEPNTLIAYSCDGYNSILLFLYYHVYLSLPSSSSQDTGDKAPMRASMLRDMINGMLCMKIV